MNPQGYRFCMLVLVSLLSLSFWSVALARAANQLAPNDCQKCHKLQIDEIAASGGAHRDAVSCVDCHLEHPPKGTQAIPACAMCHEVSDNAHFTSPDCLGCHPPHSPRNIEFSQATRVRAACSGCHQVQDDELFNYPSNHSVLDCKECHLQHGTFVSCLECHEPHLEAQTYDNCRDCHRPHMPLKVAYKNTIEPAACVVCHPQVGKILAENRTRHHDLLCVYCHKSQHKQIPGCVTCHGESHYRAIRVNFSDCNDCHVGPHDLVN